VRALRLSGQSARLGFRIDGDTLRLASTVVEELGHEPAERMLAELAKVLAEAREPARFFKVLAEANLLSITFTEIAHLPVEDFETVMARLDAVAQNTQNPKLRFAVWGSVLDKESLRLWNRRMTLPVHWLDAAIAVGKILFLLESPSPEKIVDAISNLSRGSLSVEEFDTVAKTAGFKLTALSPLKSAMTLSTNDVVPETLKGKDIGAWLRRKHVDAIAKLI
jgi:tRNA nucleotidyltransferase (CCA-adding enzyme)